MTTLVFHHGDFDGAWSEDNNDITLALDNGHIYADSPITQLKTKYGSISSVIITPATNNQYSEALTNHSAFTTYVWTPSSSIGVCNVLVVGGGGGGGSYIGGGGGAGEFVEAEGLDISTIAYTIVVGAGGEGGDQDQDTPWTPYTKPNGYNSSFGVIDASINALGGGMGAAGNTYIWGVGHHGVSGGSGGGGAGAAPQGPMNEGNTIVGQSLWGDNVIVGKGNNGGTGGTPGMTWKYDAWKTSGGGGGANESGHSSADPTGALPYIQPPHGGDGLPYTINSKTYWFAGGGGGGTYDHYKAGDGGKGGGGGGSSGGRHGGGNSGQVGFGDKSSITYLEPSGSPWQSVVRSDDNPDISGGLAEGADGISPNTAPHDISGRPQYPRGGNAAPHSGGGGGGATYFHQWGGNGGSGIVVISSTGSTEQGLTYAQQQEFKNKIQIGVILNNKLTFIPPIDLPNPTTAEHIANRIKEMRGEVASDIVISLEGQYIEKVLGTDLDSTLKYIIPDHKVPYERAADEFVIVEVEENASWYHQLDDNNVIQITKIKNIDENNKSKRRLTKGLWDTSYNTYDPETDNLDSHFIANGIPKIITFTYDNNWYKFTFEGVSFIFKNPDGIAPDGVEFGIEGGGDEGGSGNSCCYSLYRTCAPRTRICYAKNTPKPNIDLYCYWDEETPKNSIKRLNYPIKPNNTRDYGSKGAMNNTIRRRVHNKKDSCVSCMESSGNCVYPRILGTRAAKGNLQNGAKSGESGQATYWMNILPR